MVKGLYTASTGMINEQRRVDILSHNLANASTTGYKKEGSTSEAFKDVLAVKIKDSSESYLPRRIGTMNMGVKIGEVYTDYSQGPFHETGNDFDLAISGDGFFAVEFTNKEGEKSTMYTRDGNFITNVKGEVVNKNGDYLLSHTGDRIVVDPTQPVEIDRTGLVRQGNQVIATIALQDFEDYNYLKKYGENYLIPLDGIVEKEATGQIYSGYLESSNVQVVQEMVDLISFQRAYETNQKMIQAFDSTLEKTVSLGRL